MTQQFNRHDSLIIYLKIRITTLNKSKEQSLANEKEQYHVSLIWNFSITHSECINVNLDEWIKN